MSSLPVTAQRPEPRQRAPLQPVVHDLVVCVAAPTTVLSDQDGQLLHQGAHGLFHADVRALSRVEVLVDGAPPQAVSQGPAGRGGHRFVALLRELGDDTPDPTVRLDRLRTVAPGTWSEVLRLSSTAARPVSVRLVVVLGSDLAGVEEVKQGGARRLVPPRVRDGWPTWQTDEVSVRVGAAAGARPDVEFTGDTAELTWQVTLEPRSELEVGWHVDVHDTGAVVAAAPVTPWWPEPQVSADDRRLPALLRRSLDDLHGLRMVTGDRPDDVFAAAGSPWYLTLFGRDSIWAARMMLPLGTELAAGTLRTLAARQGSRQDAESQEQPGKILHELRRSEFAITPDGLAGGAHLPARYYGTVDATPLWVSLLHDAWRWGLAPAEVEPLLDHAVRALDWVVGEGDPDGDGFCEYVDTTGTGLSNQGWKDSGDAVRFADGRLAEPPIALCEVQGYAYEAAVHGADLLDAFGRGGTDRYRHWAERLRNAFRERFWVQGPGGAHPALALDGAKAQVDSLTSNIGHLLGTGLLSDDETATVVRRLVSDGLDSGHGLRTMDGAAGGYSPLSYHCGSVWPHDTAIVVAAMARAGHGEAAATLVEGLLTAGAAFDFRLPELYGGDRRAGILPPVPYPAACRPQAWSAAAAVCLVQAVLGVRADVPAGVLHLSPSRPSPVGRLRVDGLRVGADRVTVEVDAAGDVVHVGGTRLGVEVA